MQCPSLPIELDGRCPHRQGHLINFQMKRKSDCPENLLGTTLDDAATARRESSAREGPASLPKSAVLMYRFLHLTNSAYSSILHVHFS